jgi:hypothetical protein
MRRLLAVLVPVMLLAACGDDDDAADGPTTTVAGTEAPDEEDQTETGPGDEDVADRGPDQTAPETTVAGGAPAEDGPGGDAGDGEGLGDAVLASDLDGAGPVPGPGQTGATGRFEAELVDGTLCVDMVVTGLDSAVAEAHLHSGRAGEEGPVIAELDPPTSTSDGTSTWSDVCTGVDDEVIEDLADAPELANVDVHTGSHPGGAVRGQLTVISIFDRTLD